MSFDTRIISNIGILAAIVEVESFARAAQILGLTRSGVSRAVARLEKQMGVRLVNRTTRKVSLTDEGRRLYREVAPLLTGIEDAVTMTSGASVTVRGRLRVNVDAFFSQLILARHISEFLALYPELSLELVARDQLGDLVAEGFDIAVRFGTPPESSLVARKLLDTRMVTVASPAYVRTNGLPATPKDLENHACIQVRNSLTGDVIEKWRYQRGREMIEVRATSRLTVTEFGTLLNACLEGAGIARIKAIGVQHYIDEGALIDLFPGWLGESFPLHALYASRQLPPAKVSAFIEFIRMRLAS